MGPNINSQAPASKTSGANMRTYGNPDLTIQKLELDYLRNEYRRVVGATAPLVLSEEELEAAIADPQTEKSRIHMENLLTRTSGPGGID